MSKFRLEFAPSRLAVLFQVITYLILLMSVFFWQSNIFPYQLLLQATLACIIVHLGITKTLAEMMRVQSPVICSIDGQWLEMTRGAQVGWKITSRSRISSLLLFIHLVSPINAKHQKWCLIFRDQLSERDFRRLCRAVIFQQQVPKAN